jgi:hypothetical protein
MTAVTADDGIATMTLHTVDPVLRPLIQEGVTCRHRQEKINQNNKRVTASSPDNIVSEGAAGAKHRFSVAKVRDARG